MIQGAGHTDSPGLREYVKRLRKFHGEGIDKIILFGSKARGTAGRDSDTDVLILVKRDARNLKNQITDLAFDVMLEYSDDIEPTIFSTREWEKLTDPPTSFAFCVLREGIEL